MQLENELPNQKAPSLFSELEEYFFEKSRTYYVNFVESHDAVAVGYLAPAEKKSLLKKLRKASYFLNDKPENDALKGKCNRLIAVLSPGIELEEENVNDRFFRNAAIKRDLKSLINHCKSFVSYISAASGFNWELTGKTLKDLMDALSELHVVPEHMFKELTPDALDMKSGLEKMELEGHILGVALPYLSAFLKLTILASNEPDNPENYALGKEIVLNIMSGVINVLTWVWLNTNEVKVGDISLKDIGNIVSAFGVVVEFLSSVDDVAQHEKNQKILDEIKELEENGARTPQEYNKLLYLKNQQIESNTLSRKQIQALVLVGLSFVGVSLSIVANLVPGVASALAATIAVFNFATATFKIISTHALEIQMLKEKKEVLQKHIHTLGEGDERTDFEQQLEALDDRIIVHYQLIAVKLALNLVITALNFLILNVAVGAAPWLTMGSNILLGMGTAYFEKRLLQTDEKKVKLEEEPVLEDLNKVQDVGVVHLDANVPSPVEQVDVVNDRVEHGVEDMGLIELREEELELVVKVEEIQEALVEQEDFVQTVIQRTAAEWEEIERVVAEKATEKAAEEQKAFEEALKQVHKSVEEKLVQKSSDRPAAQEASESFKSRYNFFKQESSKKIEEVKEQVLEEEHKKDASPSSK